MPVEKGSVEKESSVFTLVNTLALAAAYFAFTMTQKFAPAVVDKAKAALPSSGK